MIYRVKVVCWFEWLADVKPEDRGKGFVRRTFLIESDNGVDAMIAGSKYAEETAEMGPLWIAFEAKEAATVQLPLEIKS